MPRLPAPGMIRAWVDDGEGLDMAWVIYPLSVAVLLYGALGLLCISTLVGVGGRRP
jgi:hypothetical protein